MKSAMPRKLATALILIALATPLGACPSQTTGTRQVAIESIKFVCLSRKDTIPTQHQVGANNAALIALGAPKVKCK